MESGQFLLFAAVMFLQKASDVHSAAIPSTCITPSALSILQNPCDDHVDKMKPATENRTLQLIGKHAGDLRPHIKGVLDIVKKERYHSPNPDLTILLPEAVQDLSISTNTTHIKHTMESVFLYVDQLIAKEKGLQLQSDIPEKLCNINRVIVKILCSLYRMGETDHIALADRSEMIKSSVQGSTHHYNHTFKELFQRFHGFLCTLMKQNGGKTSPACSE